MYVDDVDTYKCEFTSLKQKHKELFRTTDPKERDEMSQIGVVTSRWIEVKYLRPHDTNTHTHAHARQREKVRKRQKRKTDTHIQRQRQRVYSFLELFPATAVGFSHLHSSPSSSTQLLLKPLRLLCVISMFNNVMPSFEMRTGTSKLSTSASKLPTMRYLGC